MSRFFYQKILLAIFAFLLCKASFGQSMTSEIAPAGAAVETPRHENTGVSPAAANLLLAHHPDPDQAGIFQIKYALKIRGEVRLQILDPAGHPLRTLVEEIKERGSYTFEFDPTSFFLASGKYLYRLECNGATLSRSIEW